MPVSGSAYSYSYATLGEFAAWIIGWDLILEYGLSVAAVAVGWGGYVQALLDSLFGITLSNSIAAPPGDGGEFNLPAVFLVLSITALLCWGIRETARSNLVMVVIKTSILLIFIALGITAFTADNFSPFMPEGFGGAEEAAALIFFAYIGFDAVSCSGEETKNPERDMPIAIIGSLIIATLLYIAVAIVAVGALPYEQLAGDTAPLATVLDKGAGISWGADLISIGALIAITSVVLTILYGQTRIAFSMCRDGLLPRKFAQVWEARKTPVLITLDLRHPHRRPRRVPAPVRVGEARQHRDPLRVPHGERRRDHPQTHPARHGARLQGPPRPLRPPDRCRPLHLPDDQARQRDVGSLRHLAGYRRRYLFRIRPPSFDAPARRGS